MPIDIDRFKSAPKDELRKQRKPNAEVLLSFLATSSNQAYTPKEVSEETEIPPEKIGVVLSQLEARGVVRHRGDYWAIATGEDAERTLNSMRTANTVTDRLGAEDPDEWGEGIEASAEDVKSCGNTSS